MSESRSSIAGWLWNHNPFYVISALLMLYGVRQSYGGVAIGTINCWVMTGVLGTYTVLLAVVGVLIIRWGNVWDDARSILLVLLLLFLAVSESADDLFVKMESTHGGAVLMACGFSFSIVVLLGVLSASGIRLGLVYLLPLILFLALFFFSPWWCSPELNPKNSITLDWTLFLFPQVAALLTLTLIPAVRLQRQSVKNNGTPWPWPLYPWSAFVFVAVAVVLRSFSLTMTFSPTGPMWVLPDSRSGIVIDSIWRPYFLVPFALSILVLILEAGLVSGDRRLIRRVLKGAPALLVLAWPFGRTEAMLMFLNSFMSVLGSPLWICVWLLVGFYGWAVVRRVEHAHLGLSASILALSFVGPKTIDAASIMIVTPIPLFVLGGTLGFWGLVRRSSVDVLLSLGLVTIALWIYLPGTNFASIRLSVCFHLVLAVCLLLSVFGRDSLSQHLKTVGSILILAASFVVLNDSISTNVSWELRLTYGFAMFWICYLCAVFSRSRSYWLGFAGMMALVVGAIALEIYRNAASTLGRPAMAAFSWSAGMLIIGVMISAQKANWLPYVNWRDWLGVLQPKLASTATAKAGFTVESPDIATPSDD